MEVNIFISEMLTSNLDKQEDAVPTYDDWITTDPRDRDQFEDRPKKDRSAPFDVGTISVVLSSTTAGAVATYASEHNQDLTDAVDALLRIAVNRISQASAGGRKRWAGVSAEARSNAARHAVTVRWEQYRTSREGLADPADTGRTTPRTDAVDDAKTQ